MSRVQLALNVVDIDEAVAFYSKLFGTAPAKSRPGYANFAVVDPPLKLVLVEDPSAPPGSLNHLGVEVDSPAEVGAAAERLAAEGLPTALEENVACCHARQDKVWVHGADGEPWEVYTVLADIEPDEARDSSGDSATSLARCCGNDGGCGATRTAVG